MRLASLVFLVGSTLRAAETARLPVSDVVMQRTWKGAWIACPDAPERDPGVFRFRKVLDLASPPGRFLVHVSGDQRFVLFVNGRRVGIGPSRGDLFHWRFETFDLAPYLKAGQNLLVATVWSFGAQAPAAQVTDRTGFVAQGDGDAEQAANTDTSWQCAREPGHQPWPEGAAAIKQATYEVVGPGERLDAAQYDWTWDRLPGSGDLAGRWRPAVVTGSANPRTISEAPGYALSPELRWLVPDELPPMESRAVTAGSVAKATIPTAPGFPQTSPLVIAPHAKATFLFDRRELVAAYPELTFSGGRGARVRLTYQEALIKDRFTKGNRNELEGKRIFGYSDEILPDGGKGRVFRPLWWRTWRFLEIAVETADEPVSLDRLEAFATGYPFEEQARWDAGDATLAKIWSTGWRTARLCAHETYVDCPYYEQLQYVGDTRVQALISYAVAGDDRLARQAIAAYDDSRRSDGITSSRYPSSVPQYIPPFSLLWVGMVHDYWMYRDDPAFVRERLAGTRTVLDFYLGHQRPDGLVGRVPFWNFVDWAAEFAEGVPPEDKDGGSSAITLQLVAALREAADLEEAVGDAGRAALYRQRADRAAEAVWRLCWDESRGLVADTPARGPFSQQANILALWLDVVPKAKQSAVLDRLLAMGSLSVKTEPVGGTGGAPGATGIAKASYYFRFYLARALEHVGRGDDYLSLLDPWREMLDLGLSTFAETPDLASRSDCHAWSAHPNYDLLTIVAGIRPAAPGFKRVRIEPHLGSLDHLDAAMPHPAGEIAVSYRRRAGGLRAVIGLPTGLPGDLVWHGERHELVPGRNELLLP
jgi:hypothetical protein